MSENVPQTGSKFSFVTVLLALLLFGAGVVVGRWMPWPTAPDMPQLRTDLPRFAPRPVSLDLKFVDADGDLLADTPTDPAKLLDPDSLTFSYLASDDQAAFNETWAGFLAHLSKVTGKPVNYIPQSSPQAQADSMAHGRLQVAAFNTGAVPMAVNTAGFIPAFAVSSPGEPRVYQMEIVVPTASAIKSAADLRGQTLCLTDDSSNSGCKAPLYLLRKEFKLEAGRDFSVRYSGGHYASLMLVSLGEVNAAAVASVVEKRFKAARPQSAEQMRTIYTSPDFPTAAIGYANNLKPELAAKIRKAFESFDWGGSSLDKQFPGGSFQAVDYKKDWELVREIDHAMVSPPAATAPAE